MELELCFCEAILFAYLVFGYRQAVWDYLASCLRFVKVPPFAAQIEVYDQPVRSLYDPLVQDPIQHTSPEARPELVCPALTQSRSGDHPPAQTPNPA
jgi:hypothetical protein